VRLLPLSADVRALASELQPPSLRSLNAIHLATGLSVGDRLQRLYTYDERMALAAREVGLDAHSPG
jgi:predicted nucleic acid-binding protein